MSFFTHRTLGYYISRYKLKANATWDDVYEFRDKLAKNGVPCNTNATEFDYSPTLTDEKIIGDMRLAIEREKKRRAVKWDYTPYTEWKPVKQLIDKHGTDTTKVTKEYRFNSEAIKELIDRIDALGSFQVSNIERFSTGQVIKKEDLKDLGRVINQNEMMCLCDCNYCTCDCNYCTCDCNYCTCDCNYSESLVKGTYFGLTQNYGKKSTKNKNITSMDDSTNYDYSETTTNATIWAMSYCTCDCNYCTCDCKYNTCECNNCTYECK